MTESELLAAIAEIDRKKKDLRKKISELRLEALDKESELLTMRLAGEKLAEDLSLLRFNDPVANADLRDAEIERFRDRFPELCDGKD
jgi:hypothetical protein